MCSPKNMCCPWRYTKQQIGDQILFNLLKSSSNVRKGCTWLKHPKYSLIFTEEKKNFVEQFMGLFLADLGLFCRFVPGLRAVALSPRHPPHSDSANWPGANKMFFFMLSKLCCRCTRRIKVLLLLSLGTRLEKILFRVESHVFAGEEFESKWRLYKFL